MAVQLAFVVAEQHRQPAALLVIQELDYFRQIVDLYRDRQLVFGLPGFIQHHARKGLVQRGEIMLTDFSSDMLKLS